MDDDLINILSNSNKDIDDQKLMQYLSGKLSGEERHKLEKLITEPGLLNDAVEGLKQFKNTNDLSAFVVQLNTELHKQLEKKKQRRQKRKLKNEQWVYLAIILILFLIIIGFIVIREHLGK
ncbi:MAG: hypothetical protein ABIO55_12175 [Ginsengibacter sp.]